MKRPHDEAGNGEDGHDEYGVLDPSKVQEIQKKEIWTQMTYYKSMVKKYEA